MHIMSTNFAKTLVWKHGNDVKLWRDKQRTPNTNDHHMTLNQNPPHENFLRTPLISGVTSGWQGCEPPSCQAKCKNQAPSLLVFWYWLFFWLQWIVFCFFRSVFRIFRVFCIAVQYRICYCFSTIFWVLASGLSSSKFPLAQTSSYVTAPDQNKIVLLIRAICGANSGILQ